MISMKLSADEATLLYNIVESFLETLRVEIIHTDRREYREMLKQQETMVKTILEQIESQGVKVAA